MLINNLCSNSFTYLKYACGIVATLLLTWIVDKPSIPRLFYFMEHKYKVGQKIGSLTILSIQKNDPGTKSRSAVYECLCDCGKKVDRDSAYFYKSKVNNCGCYKPSKLTDRQDVIFRRLIKEKQYNCKGRYRQPIHFDLTLDEFRSIVQSHAITAVLAIQCKGLMK